MVVVVVVVVVAPAAVVVVVAATVARVVAGWSVGVLSSAARWRQHRRAPHTRTHLAQLLALGCLRALEMRLVAHDIKGLLVYRTEAVRRQ